MYGTILASIHDRWFDSLARAAASDVLGRLQGRGGARVVDGGCGSGVFLSAVAASAAELTGIDVSPEMVALARGRVPRARFIVGDVLDVELPGADVIALVGEVLSYAAAAPGFSSDRLRAFLRRASEALTPGGVMLFDVLGDEHDYSGTFFREEPEYTVVSSVRQERDLVRRRVVSFLETGPGFEKSVEVHELRTFSAEALESLLEDSGLSARRLPGYGGEPGLPGRLTWECRAA